MFLKVYGDESYKTGSDKQPRIPVFAGFLAHGAYWEVFASKWTSVLKQYEVGGVFHFADYNSKHCSQDPESDYFGWDDEKRTNYFYDLALATTYGLIPVGGAFYNFLQPSVGTSTDPVLAAASLFFNDTREALRLHFPDFSGQNGDEKVDIVFEETSQIEWKRKLIEAHEHFKANDSRFGCLSFAGKNDEAHIGLQAADFLAGVYRQAEETQAELGKPLEYERIVDLVVFKNAYPRGHKRYKLPYDLSNEAFKEMIRLLVDHEKKKKAQWRKHRIKGRIYYPEKEFDFRGYMGGLGAR